MDTNPTAAAKCSIALRLARTRAIMDVLQITPGPHQPNCLEGEELYEHVQGIYEQHLAQQEFDGPANEERKASFLQSIAQAEAHRGAFIMYHPRHAAYWRRKIENTPLHLVSSRIDKDIILFTLEMERRYGVTSFNVQDARYLLGILHERIHELKRENLASEYADAVQRLEVGIAELQEKEQTLHSLQFGKLTSSSVVQQDQATDAEEPKTRFTIRQIVLLYIYQNKPRIKGISRAREIADEYGYKSGERLYSLYNQLRDVRDRINVEGRQVRPLVEAIEGILPYLSDEQKKQADNELNTIRLRSPKLV